MIIVVYAQSPRGNMFTVLYMYTSYIRNVLHGLALFVKKHNYVVFIINFYKSHFFFFFTHIESSAFERNDKYVPNLYLPVAR